MSFYYWFRDRIPFLLTLIYFGRSKIRKIHRDFIGQYLISVTWILVLQSIGMMLRGLSLNGLVGFRWSFPSPIQWGILIIAGSETLERKGIDIFESFYLSLLAGIGGGCIYEILRGIPYWIRSDFAPWNLFNTSLTKVFLVDFQVLCLPILFGILRSRFNYRVSRGTMILLAPVLFFYMFGIQIEPFYHHLGNFGGNGVYAWVMRLPVAVILYQILSEVEKNE